MSTSPHCSLESEPPSGPTSTPWTRLSAAAASSKRLSIFFRSRTAEIRLRRSPNASTTSTSSGTGGGER